MDKLKDMPPESMIPRVALKVAHTGSRCFQVARWNHCRGPHWVIDYLHQGQQRQRIRKGNAFIRPSGLAALYAPGCDYHEWEPAGESIHESFMIFLAWGDVTTMLRRAVGRRGWCHIRDPDRLIGDSLQHLGGLMFSRRPCYEFLAHATMLQLLGRLFMASKVGPSLREVRGKMTGEKGGLAQTIESYVAKHIAETVRLADLATHAKMSLPTFARTYPRVAGESPYRTVRRLKVEAAKRLLLGEGLSVKECALRLGFSSEFHFSRLFKQLEGIPPSGYAESLSRKEP